MVGSFLTFTIISTTIFKDEVWRVVCGSDREARVWLLNKIHQRRAFWLLPDFDEKLWIFKSADDMVMLRQMGGARAELITSNDPSLNQRALDRLFQTGLKFKSHFFSLSPVEHSLCHCEGEAWAGMTEPSLLEKRIARRENSEHVANFKLWSLSLKPQGHSAYPEPMRVFVFRWSGN